MCYIVRSESLEDTLLHILSSCWACHRHTPFYEVPDTVAEKSSGITLVIWFQSFTLQRKGHAVVQVIQRVHQRAVKVEDYCCYHLRMYNKKTIRLGGKDKGKKPFLHYNVS